MGQRTSPVPCIEEGTLRVTVGRSAIRTHCHMVRGIASSRGLVMNTPKKLQQHVEHPGRVTIHLFEAINHDTPGNAFEAIS